MTLDELLALLPDNNTGAIDAADLRTIVTDLFTKAGAAAAGVVSVAGDVSALASRVTGVEGGLSTVNQNFDALFGQVQNHESRIGALEQAP
jgi:hypothetical protein